MGWNAMVNARPSARNRSFDAWSTRSYTCAIYAGETSGLLTKVSVTKKSFWPCAMAASPPISLAMLVIFALRMVDDSLGIASRGANVGGGHVAEPLV